MKTGKVHRVEVALDGDGVWRLPAGATVPPLEAGDVIEVWSPSWEAPEPRIPTWRMFQRPPWWRRLLTWLRQL